MSDLLQLLQDNHIEQVDQWLEEYPDFFHQKPQASFTLLAAALRLGSLPALQMLIKHGADVNQVGGEGSTLLREAAQFNHTTQAHVAILLDHGADVHRTDDHGNTALIYAAAWGRLALTELLIQHGAPLEVRGQDGLTALMWAIRMGGLEITQKLIESGASLLLKTPQGENLLELANREFSNSQERSQTAEYLAPLFLAAQEKEALDAVTLDAVKAVMTKQAAPSPSSLEGVNLNLVNHCEETGDIKPQSLRL